MTGYLIAVVVPTYEDCLREADACYNELRKNKVSVTGMELNRVHTENGIIEFFSRTWLNDQNQTVGQRFTKVFYANPNCPAFRYRVQEETGPHEIFLDWVFKREGVMPLRMCSKCIHENVCKYKDEVKDESARLMEKVWAKNVTISCKFFEDKER